MVLAIEREKKKKNIPLISFVKEAVRTVPVLGVNQPLLKTWSLHIERKTNPLVSIVKGAAENDSFLWESLSKTWSLQTWGGGEREHGGEVGGGEHFEKKKYSLRSELSKGAGVQLK